MPEPAGNFHHAIDIGIAGLVLSFVLSLVLSLVFSLVFSLVLSLVLSLVFSLVLNLGRTVAVARDRRRRGLRRRDARQRQIVCQKLLLQRRVFRAQPRNFALEDSAIVWRGLAGPTDGALAAHRDGAGLRIEPHNAVRDLAEAITAVLAVGHVVLRQGGHGQTEQRDDDGAGHPGLCHGGRCHL